MCIIHMVFVAIRNYTAIIIIHGQCAAHRLDTNREFSLLTSTVEFTYPLFTVNVCHKDNILFDLHGRYSFYFFSHIFIGHAMYQFLYNVLTAILYYPNLFFRWCSWVRQPTNHAKIDGDTSGVDLNRFELAICKFRRTYAMLAYRKYSNLESDSVEEKVMTETGIYECKPHLKLSSSVVF